MDFPRFEDPNGLQKDLKETMRKQGLLEFAKSANLIDGDGNIPSKNGSQKPVETNSRKRKATAITQTITPQKEDSEDEDSDEETNSKKKTN